MVQAAGGALRATCADFLKELNRRMQMRRDVRRYSNELTVQVMQTAFCNRNHSPEQRLARWLLMMRDRLSGDRYRLTQEYLGFTCPLVSLRTRKRADRGREWPGGRVLCVLSRLERWRSALNRAAEPSAVFAHAQ